MTVPKFAAVGALALTGLKMLLTYVTCRVLKRKWFPTDSNLSMSLHRRAMALNGVAISSTPLAVAMVVSS